MHTLKIPNLIVSRHLIPSALIYSQSQSRGAQVMKRRVKVFHRPWLLLFQPLWAQLPPEARHCNRLSARLYGQLPTGRAALGSCWGPVTRKGLLSWDPLWHTTTPAQFPAGLLVKILSCQSAFISKNQLVRKYQFAWLQVNVNSSLLCWLLEKPDFAMQKFFPVFWSTYTKSRALPVSLKTKHT